MGKKVIQIFLGIGKILLGWACGCLLGTALYWTVALPFGADLAVAYAMTWGGGVLGVIVAVCLLIFKRRRNLDPKMKNES